MSRQALATAILGALVVALLALQVASSQRLAKMQDQLARLEERPVAGAGTNPASPESSRSSAVSSESSGDKVAKNPSTGGSDSGPAGTNSTGAGSDEVAASGTRKSSRPVDGAMTQKDIEEMIDRRLTERDKKNPLAQIMSFEDPLVVMERELKLSPLQKTRIEEHQAERDEAVQALWSSEEARKDMKGTAAKQQEIAKKYDEAVKREMDLTQQDKYEELKKSGKLMDFMGGGGGMSIVIGKSADEAVPAPGK